MGSQFSGNRRSDEQLEAILFEMANWTVNGRNGQVLSAALNLRRALDEAADFATAGAVVAAICRTPANDIIVFEGQAERLRKLCASREAPILPETDYWRNSVDDAATGGRAR
jgi:hypothetical protein